MFTWWQIRQLTKQLKDPNVMLRESAVKELAQLDTPAAIKPLCEALADAHPDVQLAAAEALRKFPDPQAVPPLLEALGRRKLPVSVQQCLLRTLEGIGAPAIEPIAARLRDNACTYQAEMAQLLGRLQARSALPALIGAMQDDEVRVRKEALHALGEIGDPAALDGVVKVLESDARWLVRAEACETLGRLRDRRAFDTLVRCLQDESWLVQMSAAKALAALGDTRATPALIGLLQDPKEDVRGTAAEMLGKLGDPRAAEPLRELLARDPEVAVAALDGLRMLLTKSGAQFAVEELQRLANVPDPVQAVWDTGDDSSLRNTADQIRSAGTRALDASPLRKLAAAALAARSK